MKKKFLFAFAILSILSLAIAAFAYGGLAISNQDDKASCCKKDSCPIKGHEMSGDHAKGEHKSCDKCDCCKDGKCTGDSCPMKKKDGNSTAVSASDEGKRCCDNCDCCKSKANTGVA